MHIDLAISQLKRSGEVGLLREAATRPPTLREREREREKGSGGEDMNKS
jgi:hypothetical protein